MNTPLYLPKSEDFISTATIEANKISCIKPFLSQYTCLSQKSDIFSGHIAKINCNSSFHLLVPTQRFQEITLYIISILNCRILLPMTLYYGMYAGNSK